MCGNMLVVRPGAAECAASMGPLPPAEKIGSPVEPHRDLAPARPEPVEIREPEPAAVAPAARGDKWWVDEGETTVGGPSFLGLGSSESSGGGYSYLFQEEEERSHKAAWVLLVVLLVLGGVVYAKWQPIHDYVLTTALTHARPQLSAAQNNSNSQPPSTPSSAPGTTLASSDAQAPPITTENNPDQTKNDQAKTAEQKAGDPKEGLPERDNAAAGDERKTAAQPANSPTATAGASAKNEAPPEEEDASAKDEEKPAASKRARPAPVNEGGELVSTGERYLYGRGVVRNCDQAVSYFNAAAAKQNPQAYSHLGALYATGECVPMDRALAYSWFRRAYAKEPSNHYFERNLTMLWREMTPDEKQRATGQ